VALPSGAGAKDVLPAEVGEISAMMPTGAGAYLLAHRKGLSAWTGKAWTHVAPPAPDPLLGFYVIPPALATASGRRFWQPSPGQLMSLKPDASAEAVDLAALGLPKEHERDAKLLRLRGADQEGCLWFDLAMPQLGQPTPIPAAPSLAPPSPSLAPPTTPQAPVTSLEPAPDPRAEWEAYLKTGLDRVYRWKPGAKAELVDVAGRWKGAGAPPNVFAPAGTDLHPEAGGFLLGTDQRRWWLPLKALAP
jgi:hypothetical protein